MMSEETTDTAPKLPIPKHKLTIVIEGNTLDEVADELHSVYNSFWLDARSPANDAERDSFLIVSGRSQRTMVLTNPEQTPENYKDELKAWSDARKAARRV